LPLAAIRIHTTSCTSIFQTHLATLTLAVVPATSGHTSTRETQSPLAAIAVLRTGCTLVVPTQATLRTVLVLSTVCFFTDIGQT
jgi:hypothetical protein